MARMCNMRPMRNLRPMTNRERILAIIHGRELDRVPFVQYSGLAAPDAEVWAEIGRDSMGLLRWTTVHRLVAPNCRIVTEDISREGHNAVRRVMTTPTGTLTERRRFEPTYGTAHIYEHFVKTADDFRALAGYFSDIRVVEDLTALAANRRELGDDGLCLVNTGRTPFQQLWVQWCSLDDLVIGLAEEPDAVEECMAQMRRVQDEVFAIVARSDAQLVDIGDNITAPAIGVRYFERYCVPAYQQLSGMLSEREQPVPLFVHMDGGLRPLHEAIARSGVGGIDSFSPPPDDDNPPGEAIAVWPWMRLLVNFPSSVHIQPPERVYDAAADLLQQAGRSGRMQIQISENVPPGVWRTSFPQIVRAIRDFGRP